MQEENANRPNDCGDSVIWECGLVFGRFVKDAFSCEKTIKMCVKRACATILIIFFGVFMISDGPLIVLFVVVMFVWCCFYYYGIQSLVNQLAI